MKNKIKHFFAESFSIDDNRASNTEIRNTMISGARLKGSNMCILVLAIIIACVGLNMNSTATVIGAMLISPLMGCILGIGYGFATNDLKFVRKSFIGLAIEIVICIITSTIYFLISPISTACHELLARTSPTIWDALIAIAGGLAGAIALTRKEKTNVIPGVAIATAIMPPLCTCGFGLATLQINYFLGALYLFFINAFFICLSTVIVLKIMKLPKKEVANEKKIHRTLIIIAIITLVPSVYLAYNIVQETVKTNIIQTYLNTEFNYDNTQIVKSDIDLKKKEIEVALIGNILSDDEISTLTNKLKDYNINDMTLKITQTEVASGITRNEVSEIVKQQLNSADSTIQTTSKNSKDIEELQAEIVTLKAKLLGTSATSETYSSEEIKNYLKDNYSKIIDCTISKNKTIAENEVGSSDVTVVTLELSESLTSTEETEVDGYLKDKIAENVSIIKKVQ